MNQLVDVPAIVAQTKQEGDRNIRLEISFLHSHHRQWSRKTGVLNLYAAFDIHQFRAGLRSVADIGHVIHLDGDRPANLHVGLAIRFQYHAGLRSNPAAEANSR